MERCGTRGLGRPDYVSAARIVIRDSDGGVVARRTSTDQTMPGFFVPLPEGTYVVRVRMGGADCPDPFVVRVPAGTWMSVYVGCQGDDGGLETTG